MASKLESKIYEMYKGGAANAEDASDKEVDDTSTVDSDTSEIMKRLEGEDSDDEGSVVMDSDDDDDDADVAVNEKGNEDSDVDSDVESDIDSEAEDVGVAPKGKKRAADVTPSSDASEAEEEDDSDTDDEDYLQKLDDSVRHNIIGEFHPEMIQHNDEEVETLCKIVRDADGVIIDPFHKTLPFVTKYEKARILGERAKQINAGAKPFVPVEKHIIDGYLIALKEFEEKKIPFIVRRPMPNGGSEYWKLADLQILD